VPLTLNPFGFHRFPRLMLILMPIGMLLVGAGFARLAAPSPGMVTVTKHGTEYVTTIRTVKRVVHGRVVTLQGGERVVHVPLLIVHTDHKTIRVPAHNLPIHHKGGDLQAAIVATPLVPVTVTVFIPAEPVTLTSFVTATETQTVTDVVPTTITVTLPFTVPIDPTTGWLPDPD
jgi:hypothetical protein